MNVLYVVIFSLILSACADGQENLTKLEKDCFEFSVITKKYLNNLPLNLKYINSDDFKNELTLHDENLERFGERLFACQFSIFNEVDGFDEENRKRIINVHHELISVRSILGVYIKKSENVSYGGDISGVKFDLLRMLEIKNKPT
jgi:hypothetical protein